MSNQTNALFENRLLWDFLNGDQRDEYGSYPMNMKRKQAVVIKAPLLDGDNMPNMATTMAHTQENMAVRMFHRIH